MDPLRRVIELHVQKCKERGFRIFSYASSIVPGEWGNFYQEQVLMDIYDFTIHARRINEICEFKDSEFPSVQITRFKFSDDTPLALISNYHHALDRIIHARSMIIGWTKCTGNQIFLASPENKIITYIRIRTDKFSEEVNISVFGLVFVFLTDVMMRLRAKYPEYNL